MTIKKSIIYAVILSFLGFHTIATPEDLNYQPLPHIAKWFNNHTAAISLTYDDSIPYAENNKRNHQLLLENGLYMDYEIITHDYRVFPELKEYMLKKVIPAGMGYFGHGHNHVAHDTLSYEKAAISFKRCYDTLKEMGLKPVAYAYPMGSGNNSQTQKALAEAGFLCGRLHMSQQMTAPYIIPDNQMEPENWFALPTLVMQDYSFSKCAACVGNNEQLIPHLSNTLQKTAWIILTYHAIGNEKGFGFFKLEEFKKNLTTIKELNFWNASMNAVTLYIRERLHAKINIIPTLKKNKIKSLQITLNDSLDNNLYDQPLTILFSIPPSWINKKLDLIKNKRKINTYVFQSQPAMISIPPDESLWILKKH